MDLFALALALTITSTAPPGEVGELLRVADAALEKHGGVRKEAPSILCTASPASRSSSISHRSCAIPAATSRRAPPELV